MAKVFVKLIDQDPHLKLYRDPKTGIAWIEDGHTGLGYSCHPNIDASGSVAGMKRKGWWGKNDRTVRSHGFIYNIDLLSLSEDLDQVACDYCQCGGKHSGRPDRAPGGKRRSPKRYPTIKKPGDPTYSAQWSGVTGAPRARGKSCPRCGGAVHREGGSFYCPHCDDYVSAVGGGKRRHGVGAKYHCKQGHTFGQPYHEQYGGYCPECGQSAHGGTQKACPWCSPKVAAQWAKRGADPHGTLMESAASVKKLLRK